WTDSINQANKMALIAWVKETGIDLVQINGQRRYGGPPPVPWEHGMPGRLVGVEVKRVLPTCAVVGKLYEFRLMMTFSGLNRGFAYAKYSNR
ncbi:Dead end protein 1, partial [Struthio camelus australis]